MKRHQLITAAKEFNEVMQLDPAIRSDLPTPDLMGKLFEAVRLIDLEMDEFTPETMTIINYLLILENDED